ncbi:fibronectin type III domain-containing protein [Aquimarina litoralis]|uniref:fibronectin type III domain-containing protein n=1 Tax=Aquimarina litoralis TaxID=584605 RepID=UPI001C59B1D5|nr:fibronectin type III domain-containing protein [Aquimarina litoralis]MBW1293944.1 hypothetical protein [Aquimarina litoralis]
MRKIVSLFYVCLSLIILSCGSDDDTFVNVPPEKVSNIEIEVIEGTLVQVSWEPSEDVNNDQISYDLVINEKILASKTNETTLQFDASQFIPNTDPDGKNNKTNRIELLAKGLSLELDIKITSFDSNGGVSEDAVVNRNVFMNRDPQEFSFNFINFDLFAYNWLEISWTPATDPDGDILSYDIYFNDTVIRENYVIGSNDVNGFLFYNQDFREFIDSEFVIRVVANDRTGGTNEISRTFNFRGTDVDLGILTLPYEENIAFEILEDEPDNKVGYTFEIERSIGFSVVQESGNVSFSLFSENGDFIANGFNNILLASLETGTYYLEVINNNFGLAANGTMNLTLQDYDSSDLDLGTLNIPFSETYNYDTTSEVDRAIAFNFSIDSQSDYVFETTFANYDTFLRLYDSFGNLIGSNDDGGAGTLSRMVGSLSAGSYSIEVSGFGSSVGLGTLSVSLQ